jgi:hypothetical protein
MGQPSSRQQGKRCITSQPLMACRTNSPFLSFYLLQVRSTTQSLPHDYNYREWLGLGYFKEEHFRP